MFVGLMLVDVLFRTCFDKSWLENHSSCLQNSFFHGNLLFFVWKKTAQQDHHLFDLLVCFITMTYNVITMSYISEGLFKLKRGAPLIYISKGFQNMLPGAQYTLTSFFSAAAMLQHLSEPTWDTADEDFLITVLYIGWLSDDLMCIYPCTKGIS